MPNDDDDAWFAPQRNGYGSSRPIAWQGWAVCIGYGLLIAAAGLLISISWVASALIILAGTMAFIWTCAQKTRGGWRWRRGEKE